MHHSWSKKSSFFLRNWIKQAILCNFMIIDFAAFARHAKFAKHLEKCCEMSQDVLQKTCRDVLLRETSRNVSCYFSATSCWNAQKKVVKTTQYLRRLYYIQFLTTNSMNFPSFFALIKSYWQLKFRKFSENSVNTFLKK